MNINANIGYIYNTINYKIEAIIAANEEYFVYYADTQELNDIIYIIYHKQVIVNYYKEKNKEIIYFDTANAKDKSFLHGLSYLLPFPYYMQKVVCKMIDTDKIYTVFSDLKLKDKL